MGKIFIFACNEYFQNEVIDSKIKLWNITAGHHQRGEVSFSPQIVIIPIVFLWQMFI